MCSVIVDVMYPKHICSTAVCDSNYWVSVTIGIEHSSIHDSCDLDGYGFISGEPSCWNKWYFKKSLATCSWSKIDASIIEGGKC